MSIVQHIRFYFHLGLHHTEILANLLLLLHNCVLSHRQLKRILRKLHLFRRKQFTNFETVINFIESQLQTSGQMHGYKWMHQKCIQNKLVTTQEAVRLILQHLDPLGVDTRRKRKLRRRRYRNKGPNFLWHLDCYDKLKPFGICINGCIDGFSRYVLWLRASSNTSDPRVIAKYFIDFVKEVGGCPRSIRADRGTENTYVADMQVFLRECAGINVDGMLPAFICGKSSANQRIEAWWAILRQHMSDFWIRFFRNLSDSGLFNGSLLDKSLVQFCFLRIIQVSYCTKKYANNLQIHLL